MNYQKLISSENLSLDELPKEAKSGIAAVDKLVSRYEDEDVPEAVQKKINQFDERITKSIQDYLSSKKPEDNTKGLAIESELLNLIKEGVKTLTMRELKAKAPKSYDAVFNAYDEDEDNGIETSRVKLLETDSETFTLSAK